jgi:hypothetical protein
MLVKPEQLLVNVTQDRSSPSVPLAVQPLAKGPIYDS